MKKILVIGANSSNETNVKELVKQANEVTQVREKSVREAAKTKRGILLRIKKNINQEVKPRDKIYYQIRIATHDDFIDEDSPLNKIKMNNSKFMGNQPSVPKKRGR